MPFFTVPHLTGVARLRCSALTPGRTARYPAVTKHSGWLKHPRQGDWVSRSALSWPQKAIRGSYNHSSRNATFAPASHPHGCIKPPTGDWALA